MAKKTLMCGNDSCGEGAVLAGCRFYAGYPITPQNELTAYMAKRMHEVGGVFIQAESELAAINMVLGASLAGARAMTSSSGPGISLKQEGISYLVGCELPAVIVNVQRGGPGLGNIAPSQADYFQATRGGGHGDYNTIVLAPSTVQEMLDFTYTAFELADKYRNPVIVLSDGLLGQMMEPIQILDSRYRTPDSDKRKGIAGKAWALTGCKDREPNVIRSLYLGEGVLEERNRLLQEKFNKMRNAEVRYELFHQRDSEIVLVAYGATARMAKSCMERIRQRGLKVGFLRPITLWPFPYSAIENLAKDDKKFLVIEMSAGQMVEDVRLGVGNRTEVRFCGRTGGGIPTEEEILGRTEQMI